MAFATHTISPGPHPPHPSGIAPYGCRRTASREPPDARKRREDHRLAVDLHHRLEAPCIHAAEDGREEVPALHVVDRDAGGERVIRRHHDEVFPPENTLPIEETGEPGHIDLDRRVIVADDERPVVSDRPVAVDHRVAAAVVALDRPPRDRGEHRVVRSRDEDDLALRAEGRKNYLERLHDAPAHPVEGVEYIPVEDEDRRVEPVEYRLEPLDQRLLFVKREVEPLPVERLGKPDVDIGGDAGVDIPDVESAPVEPEPGEEVGLADRAHAAAPLPMLLITRLWNSRRIESRSSAYIASEMPSVAIPNASGLGDAVRVRAISISPAPIPPTIFSMFATSNRSSITSR